MADISVAGFRQFRQSRWWTYLVRPALLIVLSFLVARILISLVGSVDWQEVWTALGRLDWLTGFVLIVLLVLRQTLNSVPLAVFIPKLSLWRGLQNDLSANLVGTLAPPPGDVVVRISMFKSWGITAVDGMPGVTLNTLVFYVIRFGMPIVGLLFLIGYDISTGQVWAAIGSAVIACLMVTALILVSRGDRFARLLGRVAARVARRFKPEVDEESWGTAVSQFRSTMSERLVRGLPTSLLALALMVNVDGFILLTSLRAVGVGGGLLSALLILGSFCIAYPLTALPLAGLGVLDAALLVSFTEVAGKVYEPEIVAALVVWRVVTLLGALILGGITFGIWRLTKGSQPAPDEKEASEVRE